MCGITGIYAFNLVGKFHRINIAAATQSMARRGPDFEDTYVDDWIGLGHRRLCIIDVSEKAHQPMWDETGRFAIVYNGEIFNYQELRRELEGTGTAFHSESDTEVLLQLYIRHKHQCLEKLNGFFAFCIYDKQEQSFFLARDRYGVKPLFYVFDEDKFIFASELKSVLQYGVGRSIDYASLATYLQLNYIPAPHTIFRDVHKLQPGHYLRITRQKMESGCWYTLPATADPAPPSREDAEKRIVDLMDSAVRDRLVSDVPLGAFLSGGIDSSIVTGLARKHKPDLQTFSIGFSGDAAFFDETPYATMVARHFNTDHTVFTLSGDDMLDHLHHALNYFDEPFADSSALNLYILSRETRKRVTVALTGDGADEVFAGYNKHEAFLRSLRPGWREKSVTALRGVWRILPQSRDQAFSNRVRQMARFAEGAALPPAERYWQWASFAALRDALALLRPEAQHQFSAELFEQRRSTLLRHMSEGDMNAVLRTDMEVVLSNDMLVKLDSMSMANSLELRSPFLDYRVVDFAFSLPADYKIAPGMRKRILREAFRDFLPSELFRRHKKGFEVPLRSWLRRELRSTMDDLLSRERVETQGIFDFAQVERLRRQLFSRNPGDAHARIWALVAFQWWWKKNMQEHTLNGSL